MSSVDKPVNKHDCYLKFVLCSIHVLLAYPDLGFGGFFNEFWKLNVVCFMASYGGKYVEV